MRIPLPKEASLEISAGLSGRVTSATRGAALAADIVCAQPFLLRRQGGVFDAQAHGNEFVRFEIEFQGIFSRSKGVFEYFARPPRRLYAPDLE